MSERQKGPGDVPTGKRMEHIGMEMAKSLGHQLVGKEERDQKGAAVFGSCQLRRELPLGPHCRRGWRPLR
jgi:hypothetical protein